MGDVENKILVCDGSLYTYVFWTLHFSQDAGRTGSVCGVAWFWSWLVAWMMSSTIPTFSAGHCWHTLARRILYFKAECHENEQTRYLYITRNPRYFKRLTFSPESKSIWKKRKNFTLIHLEGKKRKDISKPEVALVRRTVSHSLCIPIIKKYKDSILMLPQNLH